MESQQLSQNSPTLQLSYRTELVDKKYDGKQLSNLKEAEMQELIM
jgi:hypothetical protein